MQGLRANGMKTYLSHTFRSTFSISLPLQNKSYHRLPGMDMCVSTNKGAGCPENSKRNSGGRAQQMLYLRKGPEGSSRLSSLGSLPCIVMSLMDFRSLWNNRKVFTLDKQINKGMNLVYG